MMDPKTRPLLYEGIRVRVHRNMVRLDGDGQEIMLTEEAARALGDWLVKTTTESKSRLSEGDIG